MNIDDVGDFLGWLLAISVVLLFIGMFGMILTHYERVGGSEYFDIYVTTTPFGFFSVQGEIHGGLFFFDGTIRGAENYDVKYFQHGVLKTVVCNAEETDVIIDKTLRLERIDIRNGYWFLVWRWDAHERYEYKIHIPYLPEVDVLTEDWMGR